MHKALVALPVVLGLALPGLTAPGSPLVAADTNKVTPVNLPVNTSADEDDPHVAPDGRTLYWTHIGADGKEDLYCVKRRSLSQPWPARGAPVEGYIRTETDDRSLFQTGGRDFHYLFYATKKDKKSKNYDIYVAQRLDEGKVWSAPTPVQAVCTEEDELHPWLTSDGRALYFSRKTEDGWRVFVARRPRPSGPAGWGTPVLVKDVPPKFHHATLTPDGRTMYLQGPAGMGRWGLFTSTWTGKNWSKPEPLDALNSTEGKTGDRSPNLSRDGRFLYFASDRKGGKGGLDLYVVQTALLAKKK
jgi:hypothetical protein